MALILIGAGNSFAALSGNSMNSNESGLAVLFGEFIGTFCFLYIVVMLTSKINSMIKKGTKNIEEHLKQNSIK